MTIVFTNMLQPSTKALDVQVAKPTAAATSKSTATAERKFNDYFTAASTEKPVSMTKELDQQVTETVDRIDEVMAADTLDEVSEVVDLPMKEDALLVPVGLDGKLVPIDELMNLEDIAALLNIDVAELEAMLTDLLEEDVQLDSVWDLLTLVEAQASEVITQLTAALQGETKLAPKEVEKIIQFLKVVETLGPKTDVTLTQEQQLNSLKDLLQTLHENVKAIVAQQPDTKLVQATFVLPFQQLNVQQPVVETAVTVKQVAPTPTTMEAEQPVAITQQATPKVQTVTITLPVTNQSAQSEALAKEMQAIIQRQQIANQQGTLKLAIKLYPENLGTVRLELMHKDGLLTARLMASTAVGKEMLESQLHQLKQGLAAQNIQLDRIDVTQSLQDASRNMNSSDQHLFNNFFQREQQEEQDEEQVEEQPSFEDILEQVKEGEA